jgi:hypothetical protein
MGRAAACGAALRNFELTKSGVSDFATLERLTKREISFAFRFVAGEREQAGFRQR